VTDDMCDLSCSASVHVKARFVDQHTTPHTTGIKGVANEGGGADILVGDCGHCHGGRV
jgi:hypothetical protein